jgi:F-type H+-transporting ATPase subunit b
MVDINYTILVQLANFLVLLFILNFLLFRPVLKHLADRDGKISSSHEEARASAEKAENMVAEFERELATSRVKASQVYQALQQEGVSEQRARLAAAKAKAQEMVDKAKSEIESEAGKARETLKSEMEKLPKDIAAKLLGRAV